MKTVEVVIRIPKDDYDYMKEYRNIRSFCEKYIANQIISGTVLPKGHGKLIDSNVLWDAFQDLGQDFYEAFDFAEANAVIEADKDGE